MSPFGMLILAVVLAVVMVLLFTAIQHRRYARESNVRICAGCATPNPEHATFCRKCGKRLG